MSTATETAKAPIAPTDAPASSGHQGAVAGAEVAANATAATVYQVAVYTGDVPGAGTDGDVWVWFDGTRGRSGWRYIDNSNDNFERNSTDYFYMTLPDLGPLVACWIYFKRAGLSADWYLSTVVVNGKTFSRYNWISSNGEYRLTPA